MGSEGSRDAWPHPSLESELDSLLRSSQGGRRVADLVADWLGGHSPSPARSALKAARANLVERGIVDEEHGRRWLFLAYTVYRIVDGRSVPSAATAVELLAAGATRRPGVWKRLTRDVQRGVSSRAENFG